MRKGKKDKAHKWESRNSPAPLPSTSFRPFSSSSFFATPSSAEASSSSHRSVIDLLSRTAPRSTSRRDPLSTADSQVANVYAHFQDHVTRNQLRESRASMLRGMAGPPPPEQWQATLARSVAARDGLARQLKDRDGRRRPQDRQYEGYGREPVVECRVKSLQVLCATTVAGRLKMYKSRADEFRRMPFHLKETILECLSTGAGGTGGRLADDTLRLFRDSELRTLDLGHSAVTMEGFARFLGVPLRKGDTHGESFDYLIPTSTPSEASVASPISEVESDVPDSWEVLDTPIIKHPITTVPSHRSTSRPLTTTHIHTLSLAHTSRIRSTVPLAYLISFTLPTLVRLDLSGCFDASSGPSALGVLARRVAGLRELALRDCGWVTAEVVSNVGWNCFWLEMKVLELQGCHPGVKDVEVGLRKERSGLDVRF
ncbi:hypothetical protein HKX48_000291 [Thoreauomyces humboldtii]|nr:hypothetical protein HKX48_000291 [Thoreauomyces humboldtii]